MKKIKARKVRQKWQRIFITIFCLGSLFCIVGNIHFVEAGMNDSTITKNRIENIYAVAYNGKTHLFYLNMYQMNGRVSYCIDLGVDITTAIYHSTDDFSISYLSEDQIRYIRSISYFGYQYQGHDEYYYYMAAQELIWEYLSGIEVEWTDVLDVDGDRIDISVYKQEILDLKSSYEKDFQFNWVDGQKFSLGSEYTLEDKNQVLSQFEIVSSSHANTYIDGNFLHIEIGGDYVGRDSISLKRKGYYDYTSKLYYYDQSQRLISNGNFLEEESEMFWHVNGATLKIQLVDSKTKKPYPLGQASLMDANYELYNEDGILIDTIVTDVGGYAVVENLPYGKYSLRQVKASLGYLLNNEVTSFRFSKEFDSVVVEESVISNIIEIMKYYGEGEIYAPEEGISFSVYDSKDYKYEELITDSFGFASVWLPYGEYQFVQNNTTFGYSKVEDFSVKVLVDSYYGIRYNLMDSLIEYRIRVINLDKLSQKNIFMEGFGFRLKNKQTSEYLNYQGKDIFWTDQKGELVFPEIFSYGNYLLEQVETPFGYISNSQVWDIVVDNHSNFQLRDGVLWLDYSIYNSRILGEVDVLTTQEVFVHDENNYSYLKEKRSHIRLSLVANEDIIENGQILYNEGDEVAEVVTQEDGKGKITDLILGSYCLVDTTSSISSCFELKNSEEDNGMVRHEVEMVVYLEKTDVILKNTSDTFEVIVGSVIEFYDDKGNLIYTGMTNDEGIIVVKSLPLGHFCYRQTNVANKYLILSEKVCFDIEDSLVSKKIDLINRKRPKKLISVPNTFQDYHYFWWMIIFSVLGIGVYCYRKKNH